MSKYFNLDNKIYKLMIKNKILYHQIDLMNFVTKINFDGEELDMYREWNCFPEEFEKKLGCSKDEIYRIHYYLVGEDYTKWKDNNKLELLRDPNEDCCCMIL